MDAGVLASQHGMDDDGRQEPQRGEPHGNKQRKWTFDPHFREFVGRQSAEVPDEPQDRRKEQQGVDTALTARRSPGPQDHGQEHRVEHYAGAETDEIEQLAHVKAGRHSTRLTSSATHQPVDWTKSPHEWSFFADQLRGCSSGCCQALVSARAERHTCANAQPHSSAARSRSLV